MRKKGKHPNLAGLCNGYIHIIPLPQRQYNASASIVPVAPTVVVQQTRWIYRAGIRCPRGRGSIKKTK